MSDEFLDYLEDILDAMDKAEIILSGIKPQIQQILKDYEG